MERLIYICAGLIMNRLICILNIELQTLLIFMEKMQIFIVHVDRTRVLKFGHASGFVIEFVSILCQGRMNEAASKLFIIEYNKVHRCACFTDFCLW